MKKSNTKKSIFVRIFLLALLALSNTFAWFIYVTKVNNNVSVHVKSWDVMFQSGDKEISNTVSVDVDSLYPGMEDYTYEISAYNKSEVSATLSYTLLEANILGEEYITVEGRSERGEEVEETDLMASELEAMFRNDFPFTLSINLSSSTIDEADGSELFSININWPYENDNDELDTKWGIDAATYKELFPDKPSISLKIKVAVTQNNE